MAMSNSVKVSNRKIAEVMSPAARGENLDMRFPNFTGFMSSAIVPGSNRPESDVMTRVTRSFDKS